LKIYAYVEGFKGNFENIGGRERSKEKVKPQRHHKNLPDWSMERQGAQGEKRTGPEKVLERALPKKSCRALGRLRFGGRKTPEGGGEEDRTGKDVGLEIWVPMPTTNFLGGGKELKKRVRGLIG